MSFGLTVPSFGPNTFPANNSALFACEVQVDYAIKSLFTPILDRRAETIEVKRSAEDYETNKIHQKLRNSVFAGACSNWYMGDFGRNAASWPGTAASFWAKTMLPNWSAFDLEGGSNFWWLNAAVRNARIYAFDAVVACSMSGLALAAVNSGIADFVASKISRLRA